MIRPSSGEYPIDVSTERPRRIAAAEQPPPRWSVMIVGSGEPARTRVALGDVPVGPPVKPVPPHAGKLRDGVPPGPWRKAGMKGGVQRRDQRHPRSRAWPRSPRAPGPLCSGASGVTSRSTLSTSRVDQDHLGKPAPAVHDAMRDDVGRRADGRHGSLDRGAVPALDLQRLGGEDLELGGRPARTACT